MRRFIHHPSTDAEISCGDEVMLSCGSGGRSYLGNLHYATRYTVCQRCIAGEIDDYMGTTDLQWLVMDLFFRRKNSDNVSSLKI